MKYSPLLLLRRKALNIMKKNEIWGRVVVLLMYFKGEKSQEFINELLKLIILLNIGKKV